MRSLPRFAFCALSCGLIVAVAHADTAPAAADNPLVLTFAEPQTAGISGFRAMWDTPVVLSSDGAAASVDKGRFGVANSAYWFPDAKARKNADGTLKNGALVFDAVNRSLLVRFPGAAAAIAAKMNQGYAIGKAEIELPFKGAELWPEGYDEPAGLSFLGDLWAKTPPTWHAVAWELRKPWQADGKIGPTYNAYIAGAGYWAKYGAQDEKQDRYPMRLGPAEVSSSNPDGELDVTATLNDPIYGATPKERLAQFANCGFLVRKWETYDARYNVFGGYEWGTPTGPRGILVGAPRLVVTFTPNPNAPKVNADGLQIDVPALAAKLAKNHGGAPTAVMPDAAQIKAYARQYGFNRPVWMADWQWQRVSELNALGGFASLPDTPAAYDKWIDDIIGTAPRQWEGWSAADMLQSYYLYSAAWPAPVRQHWVDYWTAWLMPERETRDFAHNQAWVADSMGQENINKYYARTGDWRGNTSFYRYSYTQNMSTMNFNHTSALGALLGGAIIGSDRAMDDGRHGLETWPLRTWSWFDGSTQESLDHYYFAISLKDQKTFADFGPTLLDRLMGKMILAKSVEELTSSYHPGLRHFIATSGRTGMAYVFVQQEGTKHIVDILSHGGALTDIGNKNIYGGMEAIGHDALPGMIAQQTLNGPWTPDWTANMVDEKPLPYQMTNTFKEWGHYNSTPLWKRVYMGHDYGVASLDADQGGTVPVMAQWRRAEKKVDTMDELGTLVVRPGVNTTNLLDSMHFDSHHNGNPNGIVGQFGGMATLQHKNKMIVFTSPWQKADYPTYPQPIGDVKSLQTTIGLFDFQAQPGWELFVDGQPVTQYPVSLKAGQHIAIHDGASYVGITPLPSTDLGRDQEVVITDQTGPMVPMQGGGQAKPTLLIEQYNLKRDTPLREDADWKMIDQAYGGFAVELGDATEYKDFAAFQDHLAGTKLDATWNADKKEFDVSYKSGDDSLEAGYLPEYKQGDPTDTLFAYRRVNGAWPYNAPGIDRDTTLTQQGNTGHLEKNGAILTSDPGHMAYLQTEPITGTYAGFNPFPDPQKFWQLTVPGGVTLAPNGWLGLARVTVRPAENKIWIDYALRDSQKTLKGMATLMFVTGLKSAPTVLLNDRPVKANKIKANGHTAYTISLTP